MSVLDLFRLDGRVALVTGGGSGIGRAMAVALADAGAEVIVAGRSATTVDRVAASHERVTAATVDVADEASVAALADRIGAVDIVVNAAGINPRPHLDDLSPDVWDETLAVTLRGPFLVGRAFVGPMLAAGWGRVVHLGSQQSFRAFGNSGAYGAAKAGVLGLTRSQAEAWSSRGVTVNCIIPGFVRTTMTEDTFASHPDRAEELAARTLIGRNGVPEDFAGVAVFLCSDAAGFITGAIVPVDGGFSAT